MPRLIVALLLAFALGAPAAAQAPAGEAWRTLPDPPPMPAPRTSGLTPRKGALIWWAQYGKGPPLILLHGGLGHSGWWANQVPVFARSHRVIVIDSRGHGRSTRDATPYTYELMADDVLAVMDALGVRKASLVGWSDGAIIGLDIAIRHPERLDRLFAFAANADPSGVRGDTLASPTFARFVIRAGDDYRRLSATPNAYPQFTAAIEKMWDSEPHFTQADLRGVRVRTAIADGDHDEAIKREHTEMMARLIPGAKLVILPGVSHFAMVQDPALFNGAVLAFLKGH
jgi:pimeloyl-ACP methyl ester carboxylesterase